eukprot:COSAG01_NODE_31869_length_590_cov_0.798371_1_plen_33_part_10
MASPYWTALLDTLENQPPFAWLERVLSYELANK